MTATVLNTGDRSGVFEGALRINTIRATTKSVRIGGHSRQRVRFTWTFDSAGTYDITLDDQVVGTLSVTSSAGGVQVTRSVTDYGMIVTVRNASNEDDVTLELDQTSASDAPVGVSEISVSLEGNHSSFETSISRPSIRPDGIPGVSSGVPIRYIGLSSNLSDAAIAGESVTVRVEERALPADSVAENIRLFQYTRDGWVPLETVRVPANDLYSADLRGLSPLAVVSAESGSLQVVDTQPLPDWVRKNFSTRVVATVENPGDVPVTRTMTVTIDGEPVAQEAVTLEAGEQRTVQIPFTARSGAVEVNGVEVDELNAGTSYGESRLTTDSGSDSGGLERLAIRLAGLLALVVGLLGGAVYRYRQKVDKRL